MYGALGCVISVVASESTRTCTCVPVCVCVCVCVCCVCVCVCVCVCTCDKGVNTVHVDLVYECTVHISQGNDPSTVGVTHVMDITVGCRRLNGEGEEEIGLPQSQTTSSEHTIFPLLQ